MIQRTNQRLNQTIGQPLLSSSSSLPLANRFPICFSIQEPPTCELQESSNNLPRSFCFCPNPAKSSKLFSSPLSSVFPQRHSTILENLLCFSEILFATLH